MVIVFTIGWCKINNRLLILPVSLNTLPHCFSVWTASFFNLHSIRISINFLMRRVSLHHIIIFIPAIFMHSRLSRSLLPIILGHFKWVSATTIPYLVVTLPEIRAISQFILFLLINYKQIFMPMALNHPLNQRIILIFSNIKGHLILSNLWSIYWRQHLSQLKQCPYGFFCFVLLALHFSYF